MQRNVGLLAAVLIGYAGLALAQDTTGTLTGRIVDAQQLAIPGVTVSVAGPQGIRKPRLTTKVDSECRFLHQAVMWCGQCSKASPPSNNRM